MNDTLSLQHLFQDRIFLVPDYQRAYAWEDKQVQEFLDDLALLNPSRRHYTGTIILCQRAGAHHVEDGEGTRYAQVDVVDGQQRLITIVVLLSEVAKALKAFPGSSALAQAIEKRYVHTSDRDDQPLYKLSLNGDTNSFFRDHVLSAEVKGLAGISLAAEQRLLDAKTRIARYLSDAKEAQSDRETWLRELHRKVAYGLHFNLHEVDQEAEVGIIFEAMNDRGKQLTDLEKVKNYLLYAASVLDVTPDNRDKLARSVNDVWSSILKDLMTAKLGSPANEDRLLRAHWLMNYDPKARQWQGSKSIRTRFDLRSVPHAQLLDDLRTYVAGLRDARISYCDVLSPLRDGAFRSFPESGRREAERWGEKFRRIEATATFLPLLMAVRQRWPCEPERYLEVIRLCEAIAFRIYTVAKYYSNYGQAAMFDLAHQVAEGGDIDIVKEIKRLYSSRESRLAFDEFVNPASPQTWYGRRGTRYFLYEYESSLAVNRGGSPKVEWKDLESKDSIEHVLPQNISSQSYWLKRFDYETHEALKHDIGNLTLTKGNQFLGQKAFPDKKGTKDTAGYCYEKSLLLVEREIASNWDDWNAEAIEDRRARLLRWAKGRWHIDFSKIADGSYAPDEDFDDEIADS